MLRKLSQAFEGMRSLDIVAGAYGLEPTGQGSTPLAPHQFS